MPADVLALKGARTSAGTVLTKFYGLTLQGLIIQLHYLGWSYISGTFLKGPPLWVVLHYRWSLMRGTMNNIYEDHATDIRSFVCLFETLSVFKKGFSCYSYPHMVIFLTVTSHKQCSISNQSEIHCMFHNKHYRPIVMEVHQWPVDFPCKGNTEIVSIGPFY